jgi:cytochrome c peroxidase
MYIGGQFWDGRAATLADQAKVPFLNPVEMANTKAGFRIEIAERCRIRL